MGRSTASKRSSSNGPAKSGKNGDDAVKKGGTSGVRSGVPTAIPEHEHADEASDAAKSAADKLSAAKAMTVVGAVAGIMGGCGMNNFVLEMMIK